jgi:hypothetical protein
LKASEVATHECSCLHDSVEIFFQAFSPILPVSVSELQLHSVNSVWSALDFCNVRNILIKKVSLSFQEGIHSDSKSIFSKLIDSLESEPFAGHVLHFGN